MIQISFKTSIMKNPSSNLNIKKLKVKKLRKKIQIIKRNKKYKNIYTDINVYIKEFLNH
jgi:hypothetical protein